MHTRMCVHACTCTRTKTDRQTQIDIDRHRQTQTETDRHRQLQTDTDRHRDTDTETQKDTETRTQVHRDTETDRHAGSTQAGRQEAGRQTDRGNKTESERQRDLFVAQQDELAQQQTATDRDCILVTSACMPGLVLRPSAAQVVPGVGGTRRIPAQHSALCPLFVLCLRHRCRHTHTSRTCAPLCSPLQPA